jgi:hypothetical protein
VSRPYLSIQELITAPTGIDWASIPKRGATAQAQLIEQTQLCLRVSDRMDELASQLLACSVDTQEEQGPDFYLTVDNSTGEGRLICARWPVLNIVSGQWAPAAAYQQGGPPWTPIQTWQMRTEGVLLGELGSLAPGASSAGPYVIRIAPGVIDWSNGRRGCRVQVQYENGWPNAFVQASAGKPNGPAAGDSTIHVDDIAGWAGVAGRVYDGELTESVTATSVTPDTAGAISGSGLLNLGAPLVNAHAPGVRVSAMPATFQWCGLLIATAQALTRGATAITGPSTKGTITGSGKSIEDLMVEAEGIILAYARLF